MYANFGIKYGKDRTFQSDFIMLFTDGKVGIFDTKASGSREEDNKQKAKALQEHIQVENAKGKNLFGGLVIKEGKRFRINQKAEYTGFQEGIDGWVFFDSIL